MIDYAKINCYDFEKLIGSLFQKMGFEVEVTQSSGDGGVDVIAYYNNPVFKGKYLVQCKHWNQQVGQPEIRDLYGTVMHDKAIKGILITTSTFTDQALSFANDVGIECIDGKILYALLQKYNFDIKSQNLQTQKVFYEYENFNRVKYEYLKDRIAQKVLDINAYHELFVFLLSYLSDDNIEMLYSGLLEEAIIAGEKYQKKLKKKEYQSERDHYFLIILYLLHGQVLSAYEMVRTIRKPIFFKNIKNIIDDLDISQAYDNPDILMKYDFILFLSGFPQYKCFSLFYNTWLSESIIVPNINRSGFFCSDNDINVTKEMSMQLEKGVADKLFLSYQLERNASTERTILKTPTYLSFHLVRPYIEKFPQLYSELEQLEQIIS
jgi:hypothetical protein